MTETEEKVAAICLAILGLERIECDDDLYELGSDSHQAVLIALEIESGFDVSLPLEVMETTATVRALAVWIDAQHGRRATAPAEPAVRG